MSEQKSAIFESHRRILEGLAYRMLGTLSEAQDVVQETYLKWHQTEPGDIDNHRAWLMTVCSRIALNQLKNANRRRVDYTGEWLPEPCPDEYRYHNVPGFEQEIEDTISIALLLALEKLTPYERAVFLLHDVFEQPFEDIAKILGKNTVNCRKLASRARQRIAQNRPRFQSSAAEHKRLFDAFLLAAQQLDLEALVGVLSEQVELYSDGGGKVSALPYVLQGNLQVAKFFVTIFSDYHSRNITVQVKPQRFNNSHGLLFYEDGSLVTAMTIETHLGHIHRIYAVRNPEKFTGVTDCQ